MIGVGCTAEIRYRKINSGAGHMTGVGCTVEIKCEEK
jgi:hypothetical protein